MKNFLSITFSVIFLSLGYSQDNCSSAVTITLGTTTTVGTINGTAETLMCGASTGQTNAEWYTFVASGNGIVNINTNLLTNDGVTKSDDTRIIVYSGNCTSLTCVSYSDDISSDNYLTDLTFGVQAGVTYYVVFDDKWVDLGFDFTSSFTSSDCTTSFPYFETFNSDVEFYGCHKQIDNNSSGSSWIRQDLDLNSDLVTENFAINGSIAGSEDAWLITPPFNFVAGNTYSFTYKYNGANGTTRTANESMSVHLLNGQTPSSPAITTLGSYTGIVQNGTFAQLETNATTQTVTYVPTTSGNYSLAFQVNSSGSNSWLLLFEYGITEAMGVNDISNHISNSFAIYPNPVKESFSIKLGDSFNTSKTTITITDLSGKVVKTMAYSGNYNVSDLTKGIYMLTVSDGDQVESKKLIKE